MTAAKKWDFSRCVSSSHPFPHRRYTEILSPGTIAAISDWVAVATNWITRNHFGDPMDSIQLRSMATGRRDSDCRFPLDDLSFAWLKQEIEVAFNTELCESFSLSVNRQSRNQLIAIHNDFVPEEKRGDDYFTHRVVIYLTSEWGPRSGGRLGLFASNHPSSLSVAYLPEYNSAFAFAVTPQSWHGVESIGETARYTMVVSYRLDSSKLSQ